MAPHVVGSALSQTILTIASIILSGGFATTIATMYKAKPERDQVVVLPWQNLSETLGENMKTLQSDWQRERSARIEAESQIDRLERSIEEMRRTMRDQELVVHRLEDEVKLLKRQL